MASQIYGADVFDKIGPGDGYGTGLVSQHWGKQAGHCAANVGLRCGRLTEHIFHYVGGEGLHRLHLPTPEFTAILWRPPQGLRFNNGVTLHHCVVQTPLNMGLDLPKVGQVVYGRAGSRGCGQIKSGRMRHRSSKRQDKQERSIIKPVSAVWSTETRAARPG